MQQATRSLFGVAAVFVALIVIAGWAFGVLIDARDQPNRGIEPGAEGPQRVELERNPAGQYLVPGRINGTEVTFLVDTGATHVAVPAEIAEQAGLERGVEVPVETAGGRTTAWRTTLERVEIGGIRAHGVDGSINPAMPGDYVLLGMTFLRRIEFSLRDDRLILETPS